VIDQGLYFAMNSPAGATGGEPGAAAEFIRGLGFTISPADLTSAAASIEEDSLISRTGGAPTLAFGMSLIFTEAFGGGLAAFWYHFAIMFEALFILTAVDAGTRVGRFMLQDTIGNIWPRYADLSWKPASWSASAVVVALWGYMLYVGVTDPLGGINQLFPLFGISNQLLAAIALTLCVTLMFKHGKAKWAWVPGIALAWDLTTTMTASWQKVFSGDARIGYFEQRSTYKTALDDGDLLAPATDTDQMQQIITNSTVNGVLQALFAVLTLTVVLSAIPIWIKAVRSGGLPTTEVPYEPSHLVAPSDFFATREEKEAVREYEQSRRELAGSGGRR
jgi:carbon starvation protein